MGSLGRCFSKRCRKLQTFLLRFAADRENAWYVSFATVWKPRATWQVRPVILFWIIATCISKFNESRTGKDKSPDGKTQLCWEDGKAVECIKDLGSIEMVLAGSFDGKDDTYAAIVSLLLVS